MTSPVCHPHVPEMPQLKKRKMFQEKWISLIYLRGVKKKVVCLACSQHISGLKEYNLSLHYDTLHAGKHTNTERQKKLKGRR